MCNTCRRFFFFSSHAQIVSIIFFIFYSLPFSSSFYFHNGKHVVDSSKLKFEIFQSVDWIFTSTTVNFVCLLNVNNLSYTCIFGYWKLLIEYQVLFVGGCAWLKSIISQKLNEKNFCCQTLKTLIKNLWYIKYICSLVINNHISQFFNYVSVFHIFILSLDLY